MKKVFYFICYVLLPAAAALGMKLYLDKRKTCRTHVPVRIYFKPVKWKLTIE